MFRPAVRMGVGGLRRPVAPCPARPVASGLPRVQTRFFRSTQPKLILGAMPQLPGYLVGHYDLWFFWCQTPLGMFMGGPTAFVNLYQFVVMWFGIAWMNIPWVGLAGLIMYVFCYVPRFGDYDRGMTHSINYVSCVETDYYLMGWLFDDFHSWRGFFRFFIKRAKDIDEENWVWDEDERVVEPSATKVGPGGLAAFHLMNGISIRREMIERRDRWQRNWVKEGHGIFLLEPQWFFGATQDVHARERTYIGDWVEECYPWTRSSPGLALWGTPIEM